MATAHGYLLELEKLASERDGHRDGEMLERMTDLFFATADGQTEADTDVFGSIMQKVAFEVEVEARARLAERFASAARAPRALVRSLAGAEIDVARPILERSAHLTEGDLIDIARNQGQAHLQAIAKRDSLSEPVTDVIVERGDETVLAGVAANAGARFSNDGFRRLSRKASDSPQVLSALKRRNDLSADMVGEIKSAVVQRLTRQFASARPDLGSSEIESLVEHHVARMDLDSFDRSNRALDGLNQAGRISERMLVDFARARRLPETVRCLALLTGLGDSLVSHCLLRGHLLALGVLCKANGFANGTFAALLQIRSASAPLRGAVIAAAMRGYDALREESALRMLEMVRTRAETLASGPASQDSTIVNAR